MLTIYLFSLLSSYFVLILIKSNLSSLSILLSVYHKRLLLQMLFKILIDSLEPFRTFRTLLHRIGVLCIHFFVTSLDHLIAYEF